MQRFERFMKMTVLALFTTALMAWTSASIAAEGENMYLVEFEATEAGAPTTREQALELLEKLVVPSLEQLATGSKIRAGGPLVGARAGVFVVGAKSHDER